MKKAVAFVTSVLLTYLLAVVLVSQFNIARIIQLGHDVSVLEQLQTIAHDWLGMLSSYLPLITLAFLIAFLFTGLLLKRFIPHSAILYMLAGFVAILSLHLIANTIFGLSAIAPTRSSLGLITQAIIGSLGGWVFHRFAWRSH